MPLLESLTSIARNKYIQELVFYGTLYVIVLGLTEITRYQLRAAKHDGHVLPNSFDIALCFVWAWFGLLLTRSLRRGDPSTNPADIPGRGNLSPSCHGSRHMLNSVTLYRAGAKLINSFIYARACVFIVHQSGLMRKHSKASVYAVCIPISAVLAIHEANVTGAVGVYIAMFMAVASLNHHVSLCLKGCLSRPNDMITSCSVSDLFLLMMLVLGFADLNIMKEMQKRTSLISDISDDYVAGRGSVSQGNSFPGQAQVQWGPSKAQ